MKATTSFFSSVLVSLLFTGLIWIPVIGLVHWDINPTNWHWVGRMILAVIFFVQVFFIWCWKYIAQGAEDTLAKRRRQLSQHRKG